MGSVEAQIEERRRVLAGVRELLIRELKVQREPDELDPDTPLFGTGLRLDSVDAVELVVAMEAAFSLKLPERTVGPASMRTLNTLVDFILDHRGDGAADA